MTMAITDDRHYRNIANVIRAKTGWSDKFTPSQMASAILAIPVWEGTVPEGLIDAIATDGLGSVMSGVLSGSATQIPESAFHDCWNVTGAEFPECSTIINRAFSGCTALEYASFPVCETINGYAFNSCTALATVSASLCMDVGEGAFNSCTSLVSISLPICSNVRTIAFRGCTALASISMASCRKIGNSAFASCTSLSAVNAGTCGYIGSYAFSYCTSLVSLDLSGVPSVPTIGASAFYRTPIGGYSASAGRYGSVYVPSSLWSSFITAPNWSSISARIVSVTGE